LRCLLINLFGVKEHFTTDVAFYSRPPSSPLR
jgi:hypothetical protein